MRNILTIVFILSSMTAQAGTTSGGNSGLNTASIMVSKPNPDASGVPNPSTVLRTVAGQGIRMPGLDQVTSLMKIEKHEGCENEVECQNSTPVPGDHLRFGIAFINFRDKTNPQPRSDCKCLIDKLKVGKTDQQLIDAKDAERKVINETILKAYGRKFINDFSSNIEDMSFFLNQSKDMFSSREKGLGYQCNDPQVYNQKITQVCGRRQISDPAFIKGRKDLFINALKNEGVAFDDKLDTLGREVIDVNVTPQFEVNRKANSPRVLGQLQRVNYDATRMEIMKDDPETNFFNSAITKMFSSFEMNQKLNAALAQTRTPDVALVKVLNDNKQFFNSIPNAGSYLSNLESITTSVKFLMQLHPGYNLAFKNKDAFAKLREAQSAEPDVSLRTIINDRKVLEPFVEGRCQKIVEEFANAVCTKDQDLMSSVDPKDLETLIHAESTDRTPGPKLHELLICETKNAAVIAGSAVSMVIPGLASMYDSTQDYRQSDYVTVSSGQPKIGSTNGSLAGGTVGNTMAHSSGIAALSIIVTESPDARAKVSALVDKNAATRTGFTGPGIVANDVYAQAVVSGKAMQMGSSSMSKEDARKYLAESRQFEQQKILARNSVNSTTTSSSQVADAEATKSADVNPANVVPQVLPNVTVPTPNYVSNAAAANTSNYSNNAREALKNYMADKNNPAEVDRAVSGLTDPAAEELNRLRTQNETLLQETLKAETAKYEQMKKDLENLTKKAPAVARSIASNDPVDEESSESGPRESSSGRIPRFTNSGSQAALDNSTQIASQLQGNNSASANSSSSSSSSSSAGLGKASSVQNAASGNSVEAPVSTQNSSNAQSGITISAVGVREAAIPSQEISQEVQKYIEKSDLNAAAIQDIKTKGIVFKYSVKENNKVVEKEVLVKYENLNLQARQAIDIKLARKNVSNQVSKLSVLRLLIKQNQRL